jgi:hypothetical protein
MTCYEKNNRGNDTAWFPGERGEITHRDSSTPTLSSAELTRFVEMRSVTPDNGETNLSFEDVQPMTDIFNISR